jgi:hypothetical protein
LTAINVIGITPAYAIPIYLRLRAGHRFPTGRWNLGRWSRPIGWVAVVWVACITVVFCLPQANPVTVSNFNYAPVALVVMLLLARIWWGVARRSYNTPTYDNAPQMAEFEGDVV